MIEICPNCGGKVVPKQQCLSCDSGFDSNVNEKLAAKDAEIERLRAALHTKDDALKDIGASIGGFINLPDDKQTFEECYNMLESSAAIAIKALRGEGLNEK